MSEVPLGSLDQATRDVLDEYARWTGYPNPPRPLQTYWFDVYALAKAHAELRLQVKDLQEQVARAEHAASFVIP